jgi:hypothetical protein
MRLRLGLFSPWVNGAPAARWFSAVVREVVDNRSPIRAPPIRHRTALKDRTELLSETCRKISGAACLHASAPIDASGARSISRPRGGSGPRDDGDDQIWRAPENSPVCLGLL